MIWTREADQRCNRGFPVEIYETGNSQNMTHGNLAQLLKSTNAEAHIKLEQAVDIMSPAITIAAYAELIRRFYGFIKPWEDQLRSLLPEALMPLFANRYKTAWLWQDLTILDSLSGSVSRPSGGSISILCETLPDMSTTARLLGSAYVIEGSSLGGRIITSHLAHHFGSDGAVPYRYFQCYGSKTGSMWKSYLAALAASIPRKDYPEALDASAQTFVCLTRWFSRHQTPTTESP